MLRLRIQTDPAWVQCVLQDFNAFLVDHAAAERKASASAIHLAVHYPDRPEMVKACIELAREELEHFQQVVDVLYDRGQTMQPDQRDPYVNRLLKLNRKGTQAYMLDRLLIFAVVEARGCERFGLIAAALPEGPLKTFYQDITASEARHHGLFVRLARLYFGRDEVQSRLDEILEAEAEIVAELPIRAALH